MEVEPEWLSPPSLKAATGVQRLLAARVERADRLGEVRLVAGVDTSSMFRRQNAPVHAAVVVTDAATDEIVDLGEWSEAPPFPYVPGYLGFRECPALVRAFERLRRPPDLILVDGQGISHPRRLGIASHFGAMLDLPTIGIAKSILVGEPQGTLGPHPGDRIALVHQQETVAAALRTRARAAPVYVSTGHRVSLPTALDWALRLSGGYRLPRPIRLAHAAANALRRRQEGDAAASALP